MADSSSTEAASSTEASEGGGLALAPAREDWGAGGPDQGSVTGGPGATGGVVRRRTSTFPGRGGVARVEGEVEGEVDQERARMHLHLLEEELKEVTEERDNLVVKLQKNQKLVKRTRRLQKARMHLHLLEEELKEVTEERDNLVVKLQKNQKLVHQTEVLLVKRKPLEEELKEVKEERNNLMAKLQKNEKLVAELQGAVECPVCLVVPRQGPVPCCPSGHITCSPCLERMRGEGEEECPTCRVPMGEGKSLLAKHIIENMEHQCSHQGCEEMVAFEGYREHQEACSYRLVICPGNDKRCNEMVPFCQMEDHLETCSGTYFLYEKELEVEARKNELDGACTSAEFYNNFGEVFCLRMNKTNNLYSMEVVMLGKEEECEQFTMEVAVMNPDTNTAAILARFKPRPILATNDTGHFCLTFKQESLARVWKYDKERRSYKFKIVIKVVSTCEESPKKHLEADTEPFTLCDEFGAMDLSDSDQDPDYSPSEEEDCEDSIEYDSEAVVTEEDSEEDSEEETEEDSEEEHGEEEETAVVVKAM